MSAGHSAATAASAPRTVAHDASTVNVLAPAAGVVWLVAAALTFWLVDSWTARVGFLVVATMLLPLIVVLVRDPTRRTR